MVARILDDLYGARQVVADPKKQLQFAIDAYATIPRDPLAKWALGEEVREPRG